MEWEAWRIYFVYSSSFLMSLQILIEKTPINIESEVIKMINATPINIKEISILIPPNR